jgi:hypothetical protein
MRKTLTFTNLNHEPVRVAIFSIESVELAGPEQTVLLLSGGRRLPVLEPTAVVRAALRSATEWYQPARFTPFSLM